MCTHRRVARAPLARCRAAHRPIDPSSPCIKPAGRTMPDRARHCAICAGCQAACAEAAELGC
eukprot:6606404-Prymnesium_polylepis.1